MAISRMAVTALDGRRIAVTGASGFIGARTVEFLTLATGAAVHACVRSFSRLGRLAELPQDRLSFHELDVLDKVSAYSAFHGCDTAVHCAYGNEGTEHARWVTTLGGTRVVVQAAEEASIQRLVHLSTAAIHDTSASAVLNEATPLLRATADSYEAAKNESEEIVNASSINTICLRPTVVYGPWGKDWTIQPLTRLAAGQGGLPQDAGDGVCNAVYVDDVTRAILHACVSEASGPFIIAASESISWAQFYDAFRDLLRPVPPITTTHIEEWELALYAERAKADISRARRDLGYEPRVSFQNGMKRVQEWMAWAGLRNAEVSEI